MSSGSRPAVRMARRAATEAIEAVVSWAAATRRSRIPVRRHDPLVVRVDHLLEVGVGEDLVGDVASPAGDVGAADRRALVHHDGSTSMSGCLAFTSLPFSAWMRATRPERSLLISLNSFIASMRPTTWPATISPPTVTYGAVPGDGEPYQIPVRGALTDGRAGAAGCDRRRGLRPTRPGRRRASPRRRRAAGGRCDRDRLPEDEPGAADLDLQLGQLASGRGGPPAGRRGRGGPRHRGRSVAPARRRRPRRARPGRPRLRARAGRARPRRGVAGSRGSAPSVIRPTAGRRGRRSGRRSRTSC